jgi:hypothetical protein
MQSVRKMNQSGKQLPTTVEQAVDRLISELPFSEKMKIANMGKGNLMDLYFSLSVDIEAKFCIWENKALLDSCHTASGDKVFYAEEASFIIIMELWKRLQKIRKYEI